MTLPLTLSGSSAAAEEAAQTHDVSSGGVYFEIGEAPQPGSRMEFVLTLPTAITLSSPVQVRCHGKVVRVDRSAGRRVGVAATIDHYEFLRAKAESDDAYIPLV